MPDMGEGDGKILEWYKKEGDLVFVSVHLLQRIFLRFQAEKLLDIRHGFLANPFSQLSHSS